MSAFREPRAGESLDETRERQEELIRYVIDRHQWPRSRALALLDQLDMQGLAYLVMDMRMERAGMAKLDYSPFAKGFEV